MTRQNYTFADISAAFVRKAANYVGWRYRHYGVEADDVAQELYVWLYSESGQKKVERWLENEPQQTTRIYRTLLDRGLGYAEREKAVRVGYEVDDVTWYTPNMIEALLPLALDEDYAGGLDQQKAPGGSHGRKAPHEGADLLAMTLDVRGAAERSGLFGYFLDADSEDADWADNVLTLINFLGGERPYIGRRRVMSNAQSQAITRGQVE